MSPRRTPNSVSAGLGTRLVVDVPVTPFAARVLEVVERIPRGKVLTYGDVAEAIGSRAARAVGATMARYGRDTHWQRVVCADGRPAPCLPEEARALLRQDGAPLLSDGRVDLARARWDCP